LRNNRNAGASGDQGDGREDIRYTIDYARNEIALLTESGRMLKKAHFGFESGRKKALPSEHVGWDGATFFG